MSFVPKVSKTKTSNMKIVRFKINWFSSFKIPRNDDAPKHDKIVGFKQTAVKVLLELPETARNCILNTVSVYGWESP